MATVRPDLQEVPPTYYNSAASRAKEGRRIPGRRSLGGCRMDGGAR